MNTRLPLIIAVAIVALCNVSHGGSKPALKSLAAGESSQAATGANSVTPPPIALEPLPQEYLEHFNDPAFAPWRFMFLHRYEGDCMSFYAFYFPVSGSVEIEGDTIDPEVSYPPFTHVEAQQAFADLVGYIGDHPDVFFTYDEFEEGLQDHHWLFVFAANPPDHYYGIRKCKLPNGMTPPEVEYVMNHIITDLMMVDLPPNHDPVCDLEDVDDIVAEWGDPVPVHFDATGTTEPDYDPLTFAWDFDGDEVFGENPDDGYTGVPNNPIHTYNLPVGVHDLTVSVKVTDPDDAESICETSFTITVWMTETR
jgi:hypothetical protein